MLGVSLVAVWRYESDGTGTVVGAWSEPPHRFQAGSRWPLDDTAIIARVRETGRPARIDDFADVPGTIAEAVRETGIRSAAGAPIVVDGDLWGAMAAGATEGEPLPDHIEDRLAEFTELVATAISNSASREELARLADEQAALRRVATLVARGRPAGRKSSRRSREEVGLLLGVDATHMARYELDGTATGVAAWSPAGDHPPVGTRVSSKATSIVGIVSRTGRAARMDSYEKRPALRPHLGRELGLRSSVGAPIVVDGRLWGVMIVSSKDDRPLPADTSRGSPRSRSWCDGDLEHRGAEEVGGSPTSRPRCGAWRRWSRGSAPGEVFAAVAEEVGRLLRVDRDGCPLRGRRHGDRRRGLGRASTTRSRSALGCAWRRRTSPRLVLRTGRPARIDDYANATGPLADLRPRPGAPLGGRRPDRRRGTAVGRDGRRLAARANRCRPAPESRIGEFTELVATAISNIQARSDLAASRARIVAATDEERRRVVRDLHDGAQQRLVHTVITLKLARRALQSEDGAAPALADRGARPGRARDGRAARARARHPAGGPHPAAGCAPEWRRSRRGCRCRSRTTCPWAGSLPRSRRPRTSSSPRRSRTWRSTRAPDAPRSRRASRTARSGSRCATTASAAPGPTAAGSSGWRTGSPSSTACSGSRARPAAARSSPRTSRSRLSRPGRPSPRRRDRSPRAGDRYRREPRR